MIEDFVSFVGMLLFGFLLFMGSLNMYIGTTKWYQLQAETQFVADAVAQSGGYTATTDGNFRDFLRMRNFDPGELTVNITPTATSADPDLYGTEVVVTMTYPFKFNIWGKGSGIVLFPLETYTSSMATYEPNVQPGYQNIQETYVEPNFGGGEI